MEVTPRLTVSTPCAPFNMLQDSATRSSRTSSRPWHPLRSRLALWAPPARGRRASSPPAPPPRSPSSPRRPPTPREPPPCRLAEKRGAVAPGPGQRSRGRGGGGGRGGVGVGGVGKGAVSRCFQSHELKSPTKGKPEFRYRVPGKNSTRKPRRTWWPGQFRAGMVFDWEAKLKEIKQKVHTMLGSTKVGFYMESMCRMLNRYSLLQWSVLELTSH